jgi:NAD(P)-dependent dehydrogenase (short-subunit alcohol dehydrogenase family)
MDSNIDRNGLAVITGAAHRLGRFIALKLSQMGYAVGIHYFSSDIEAQNVREEIGAMGRPAFIFQANLTDEDDIRRMFTEINETKYTLKVLVNSAALMIKGGLDSLDTTSWDLMMNLNLRAPWLCSKYAAKIMPEGSLILNISDTGAGRMWTGYPAYVISKEGLEVLTRLMALTFAPQIRVNAIAPGLILPAEGMDRQQWEKLVKKLPVKKQGSPLDITNAIEFLLNNDYITGQTLVVDGGYQLV